MSDFRCIDNSQAKELMSQGAAVFDIRDANSFQDGHPTGAINLNNDNLSQALAPISQTHPILIFCYHGISSQNAASFIASQGFTNVMSVDGGFEEWRVQQQEHIEVTQSTTEK